MIRIISTLVTTIIFFLISGCSSFFKQGEVTNIVYDTIRVKVDEYNNLRRTAMTGIPITKRAVFTGPDQEVTFQQGEQLELISDGIDFSQYSFDVRTDDETDEITIKVVDKQDSKVLLSKMCQTIERMNTDKIPEVEIADNLPPQQVVITPIVDEVCFVIGYQIRYGTLERGCRKNQRASEIYDSFNDCYPNNNIKKIKKRKFEQKKHDCLEWILFGIECE